MEKQSICFGRRDTNNEAMLGAIERRVKAQYNIGRRTDGVATYALTAWATSPPGSWTLWLFGRWQNVSECGLLALPPPPVTMEGISLAVVRGGVSVDQVGVPCQMLRGGGQIFLGTSRGRPRSCGQMGGSLP